jgi:hypothetical protein
MEIFNKQDGYDDFWIIADDEENTLHFCISEEYIENCNGFLFTKEDVTELRDALNEWLKNSP